MVTKTIAEVGELTSAIGTAEASLVRSVAITNTFEAIETTKARLLLSVTIAEAFEAIEAIEARLLVSVTITEAFEAVETTEAVKVAVLVRAVAGIPVLVGRSDGAGRLVDLRAIVVSRAPGTVVVRSVLTVGIVAPSFIAPLIGGVVAIPLVAVRSSLLTPIVVFDTGDGFAEAVEGVIPDATVVRAEGSLHAVHGAKVDEGVLVLRCRGGRPGVREGDVMATVVVTTVHRVPSLAGHHVVGVFVLGFVDRRDALREVHGLVAGVLEGNMFPHAFAGAGDMEEVLGRRADDGVVALDEGLSPTTVVVIPEQVAEHLLGGVAVELGVDNEDRRDESLLGGRRRSLRGRPRQWGPATPTLHARMASCS